MARGVVRFNLCELRPQFKCPTARFVSNKLVFAGDFEATLDRTQFGLNYGVDWGFPKNVRLVIQVEAIKQ